MAIYMEKIKMELGEEKINPKNMKSVEGLYFLL